MKIFRNFHLKTFIFLVVKFSVYLNRPILVMVIWNKLDPETDYINDPNSFKEKVRAISHPSP